MSDDDAQKGRDPRDSGDTQPFARQEDLDEQQEPLGGCDVEHCQRMHE